MNLLSHTFVLCFTVLKAGEPCSSHGKQAGDTTLHKKNLNASKLFFFFFSRTVAPRIEVGGH